MAINDGRRQNKLDLRYPVKGLSESYGFSDQPVNTSRDERNMRPWDPQTGRMRGTQRAGLGLLTGATPANGAAKISDLASVQREVNILNWAVPATPFTRGTVGFTKDQGQSDSHCVDLRIDAFDTYWALCRAGQVAKLNDDGQLIKYIDTPIDREQKFFAGRLAIDPYGNCFVASAADTSHSAADNDDAVIYGYELMPDGSYRNAWALKPGMQIVDIGIYGADLYVFGFEKGAAPGDCTLVFRRYAQYGFAEVPVEETNSTWLYPYATGSHWVMTTLDYHITGEMSIRPDGDCYVTLALNDFSTGTAAQKYGMLARLKPISTVADEEVWIINHANGLAIDEPIGACVKYSEKKASGGGDVLWTTASSAQSNGKHVGVWTDITAGTAAPLLPTLQGDYSIDTGSTASQGFLSTTPGPEKQRSAIDQNGNLYLPYHGNDSNSVHNGKHLLILQFAETSPNWTISAAATHANSALGLVTVPIAVATTRSIPDYNKTPAPATYGDVVVVGGSTQTTTEPNHSVVVAELVSPTIVDTLPIREVQQVAAAGGNWYKYTSSGFTLINDVDGAAYTYNSNTNYVSSAAGRGLIFYTDGHRYHYYDPAKNAMYRWRSSTQGAIPPRCRLIEFWRNRVVIARSDDVPGAWHMSRFGNAFDWDQFPTIADAGAAVSSTTSKAGACPDSINSMVPITDDQLLFGCDRSIWRLSGDPGSGGQLDLISDEIGMSWGRPWCKDADGRVWFFGSKGGLYTFSNGQLQDVSLGRVRKRLQDIDLATYYVRLAYNYVEDGVHIFVMPFTGSPTGTLIDHYFYDKRTDSWHVDKYGRTNTDLIQPTAVVVSDGDAPQDRAIHLGGEDGRVRVFGRDATGATPLNDEKNATTDVPIDSYVLIGPLADVRDDSAAAMSDFKAVLAPNYSGCNYEFYETDNAAHLGDPQQRGDLRAGRNASQLIRVSGDSIYLRLRNARDGETWSYEKGSVFNTYAGETRPR